MKPLCTAVLACVFYASPASAVDVAVAHGVGDAGARTAAPVSAAALFDDGVRQLRNGAFAAAAQRFTALLQLAPEMPEAHVNLGFALLGHSALAEARVAFERAIELRPSQANAYYGLGVANERLGRMPEAIGAMRAYVHLAPAGDAHVRRARAALWEWQARDTTRSSVAPAQQQ